MKIQILRRTECHKAEGLAVVIDVLRAFTTAAFAFDAGAKEIILVASAEEAFHLQKNSDNILLMGEQDGNFIQGFHFGNSPAQFFSKDLTNRTIVQRTSSGTQGVVGCRHTPRIMRYVGSTEKQ